MAVEEGSVTWVELLGGRRAVHMGMTDVGGQCHVGMAAGGLTSCSKPPDYFWKDGGC